MSYFAATFARALDGQWMGNDRDLGQVENLEDLVEMMRDAASASELVLFFLEENDEWFALVRVDGDGEPRVFISDLRAPLGSDLAAIIYEGIGAQAVSEEESEPARAAAGEPGGDSELLADLDVSSDELVELCVEEGLLPADALAALAERLGFTEELEKFR